MDPQDRLYSSDWAGRACALLRRRHPGCTPLFLTGCGADQNPHPRGTPALSGQYGGELADAVDAVLSAPVEELAPTLRVAAASVPLEMVPVTLESLEESLASNDAPRQFKARILKDRLSRGETLETSYPAPLQVALLGDRLLMIFLSGETVIDWSHKFKDDFASTAKFPHVWTSGYCNDMYGYVPTARVQAEGGYEGGRANLWSWLPSPWTDSVETRITSTIHRLVRQVAGSR